MYSPLQDLVSSLVTPRGEAIPIKGVSISGEVMGARAKIILRQRYLHNGPNPVEAIYTFPVPSDAVVIGFSMECAGRRMESIVKEAEDAGRDYEQAIREGHGAALLQKARPNVFTVSVGHIRPGEETLIEIVYLQRLSASEGALRLLIPTLVAPRYTSPSSGGSAQSPHPPIEYSKDALYTLTVDLMFDLGRAISIESPSHDIVIEDLQGQRSHAKRVRLEKPEPALDRDLVISAFGDEAEQAAGFLAHKQPDEPGTFALTIVPDFQQKRSKRLGTDVVFVIDVSGSMEGLSIEQAQSALKLCLRHLREGDRVQLIAFSTHFTTFQPQLVPFTQGTLEAADRWVNALEANGGTEIQKPLLRAVADLNKNRSERPRIIVLMTDGQVTDEHSIVSGVEQNAHGVRIYTFGIGTSVSDFIVRELAKRTGGAAEFIYPGERIDQKVTAQFAKATALRVENPSLRFEGMSADECVPHTLPPLCDGEPWTVYGRYSTPGSGRAELNGSLAGSPFSLSIPIELPAQSSRPDLELLWAAGRITDLEHDATYASKDKSGPARQMAIDLSIKHRIACQFTAMLAVEHREGERRGESPPERTVIPVAAPAGWGMFEGAKATGVPSSTQAGMLGGSPDIMARALRIAGPSALLASTGAPPLPPAPLAKPLAPKSPSAPPAAPRRASLGAAVKGAFQKLFGADEPEEAAPPPPAPLRAQEAQAAAPVQPAKNFIELQISLDELMTLQRADGLWELPANTLGVKHPDDARLLATAQALLRCHQAGADTHHPMFGVPIRKAVEALCDALVQRPAGQADMRALKAAIAAGLLLASRRLRASVLGAAEAVHLKEWAGHLSTADITKKALAELLIPR